MKYQKDVIKKIYRSASEKMQNVVGTEETARINDEIAKSYNLTTKQRLDLGDEVTIYLLGITPEDSLEESLKGRLHTTDQTAKEIVGKIKSMIVPNIDKVEFTKQKELAKQVLAEKNTGNNLEIPSEDLPAVVPQTSPEATQGKAGEKVYDTAPQNKPFQAPATPTSIPSAPVNLPTDNNVPKFEKSVDFPAHEEKPATPAPVILEKKEEVKPEPAKVPTLTHYPKGQDPYREPIE